MFYNTDEQKNQTSGLDIYMNDNYSGHMLIDNNYLD